MVSNLLEVTGLIGLATSIFILAGPGWGLLAGSVGLIVYGIALGRRAE